MKPFKNYGVINEIRDTDYLAGTLPYEIRNESGDWTWYVPKGENQYSQATDTMACVSFSFLNCLETQVKFLTGQEIDFSDRFLAKISNTTHQGNYLSVVADAFRHNGCVIENEWPAPANFTWEEYYAEIPQEVKDKALGIRELYEVTYEWVDVDNPSLQHHLKQAPLQLVIPGHAICGVYEQADIFKFFDSYAPYLKDYTNPPMYAMKIVLTLKKKPLTEKEVRKLQALEGYKDEAGVAFWTGKPLADYLMARLNDKKKGIEDVIYAIL